MGHQPLLLLLAVLAGFRVLHTHSARSRRRADGDNDKPAGDKRKRGQKKPKRTKVSKEAKVLRKQQYEKAKQKPSKDHSTAAARVSAIEAKAAKSGTRWWFEVDLEAKNLDIVSSAPDIESSSLSVFRDLKDLNAEARQGLCIVSGPEPLQILLNSKLRIVALALRRPVLQRLQNKGGLDERCGFDGEKHRVPVFVLSREQFSDLVGFSSCRGSLACAVVPPQRPLSAILPATRRRWRVVAIDGNSSAADVGSVIRTATVLGADALLLSDDSCDCWCRQAVRVSMGHVLSLLVLRCKLAPTLRQLHREGGMVSFAAVFDTDASTLVQGAETGVLPATAPERWCVVIGNEQNHISGSVRDACNHRVRVPLLGAPSVQVTIAAGIVIAGLVQRESTVIALE